MDSHSEFSLSTRLILDAGFTDAYGIFSRLRTGLGLAIDALSVLRDEPELAAFPLVAGVAGLVYLAVLGGAIATVRGPRTAPATVTGSHSVLATVGGHVVFYALLFVLYVGSTFVASFFTAGLVHETRKAFAGREPSFRDGLSAAWANVGTLFAWALISATVGLIVRAIENRSGLVGKIIASLVGVAWSVLTYFVVPVIAFEDVGVVDAIKRSGTTFKDTWGETAGAGFGVGVITVLFVGAAIAITAVLFVVVSKVASAATLGVLALGAVLILLAYLASVTLGAIVRTALYVYATDGQMPKPFKNMDPTLR